MSQAVKDYRLIRKNRFVMCICLSAQKKKTRHYILIDSQWQHLGIVVVVVVDNLLNST